MNKTTQKVMLISFGMALAAIWAANNIDQIDDLVGDRGWF